MRPQNIPVPQGAGTASQFQRPTISSPNFFSGPSNVSASILGALAGATGALVQARARKEQRNEQAADDAYQAINEQIEQLETSYVQAKAAGDSEGAELVFRKMTEFTGTAATSGDLRPQHRSELHNKLQRFVSSDAEMADRIAANEQRARDAYLSSVANTTKNAVSLDLALPATVKAFVDLGHNGFDVYPQLQEEVKTSFADFLIRQNPDLSPDDIGEMLATEQFAKAQADAVHSVATAIHRKWSDEQSARLQQMKDMDQRNIANNVDASAAERIQSLMNTGMQYDDARKLVAEYNAEYLNSETPLDQSGLRTLDRLLLDRESPLTETQRNEVIRQVAGRVAAATTAGMDPRYIEAGIGVADSLANTLQAYGIRTEWSEQGVPTFSGAASQSAYAIAAELAPMMRKGRMTVPENTAILNARQGNDVIKNTGIMLIPGIFDGSDPATSLPVLQQSVESLESLLTRTQGPEAAKETADAWRSRLGKLYHAGVEGNEEAFRQLSHAGGSLLSEFIAANGNIIPTEMASNLVDMFTNQGNQGVAFVVGAIRSNQFVASELLKNQSVPADVKFALNEITKRVLAGATEIQDFDEMTVNVFREKYRRSSELQATLQTDLYRSGSQALAEVRKVYGKLFEVMPMSIADPLSDSNFKMQLAVQHQLNPTGSWKDKVNATAEMMAANGYTPYVAYSPDGVGRLSFSPSPNAVSLTEQQLIRKDLFDILGRRQARLQIPLDDIGTTYIFQNNPNLSSGFLRNKMRGVDPKFVIYHRDDILVGIQNTLVNTFGADPLDAQGITELLAGRDPDSILFTQTDDQTVDGGMTIVYTLFDAGRNARITKSIPVDAQFIYELRSLGRVGR